MHRLLAAVLAVLLAIAPVAGFAQSVPTPPAVAAPTVLGLPPGQAVTVGVGIIAGVIGLQAIAGGTASVVVGAIAGALIGNWWYGTYGPTLAPVTGAVPRT